MQTAPVAAGYPLGSSAELDFTPFLGKTRLFQVLLSLDSPWKTISGSLLTFETLTLKAFSLSVSSVTNTALATPCSFLGFKWAALQFTESAHKQKCMQLLRMLISRSKGNSKHLMQLNMCARYENRQTELSLNYSRSKLPEKANLQPERLREVEWGLQNNYMLLIEKC